MKIVMCCSNGKNGSNILHNGKEVAFISKGKKPDFDGISAHPDEVIPNDSISWRNLIEQQKNEMGMLEAYALYENQIYRELYKVYKNNLYIYSAGWGIVNAEYKLPNYNISFSNQSEEWVKRTKYMKFNDFNHLKNCDESELIVLISGKDYIKPFYDLTKCLPNKKVVICSGKGAKETVNNLGDKLFTYEFYETTKRTNWHYEYADKLVKGQINIYSNN